MLAYYSSYVLRGSCLRSNIAWQIALSEYIVFSVISFLITTQDGLTAMGERYRRFPDSIKLGVLAPLPSRLLRDIEEVGFFNIVRSTDFDSALVYVASRRACKVNWRLVPGSCHHFS